MTTVLAQPALPGAAAPPQIAVVTTRAELADTLDAVRASGRTVGLVPTMGALHAGHRVLVERAVAECDVAVVTIFVNPTQFGDPSDLEHYPRTFDVDLAVVADAGADLVFAPSIPEMYPDWPAPTATSVVAPAVSHRWEGASRPGHFDGVATVVVKLLSAAGRCRAYFGEKDFQQLAVVLRLVRDLSLPTEVVGCPIVREPDGLALSSRNVRLSGVERSAALALSRALASGAEVIRLGETRPEAVEAVMDRVLSVEPLVAVDYAAVVVADDLEPARTCATSDPLRLLVAGSVGPVRLIDNVDPRAGH